MCNILNQCNNANAYSHILEIAFLQGIKTPSCLSVMTPRYCSGYCCIIVKYKNHSLRMLIRISVSQVLLHVALTCGKNGSTEAETGYWHRHRKVNTFLKTTRTNLIPMKVIRNFMMLISAKFLELGFGILTVLLSSDTHDKHRCQRLSIRGQGKHLGDSLWS